MSQSLESSHGSLHKHNRKWDVCGKGSGEGAGVMTVECGSGLTPPYSAQSCTGGPGERDQVLSSI